MYSATGRGSCLGCGSWQTGSPSSWEGAAGRVGGGSECPDLAPLGRGNSHPGKDAKSRARRRKRACVRRVQPCCRELAPGSVQRMRHFLGINWPAHRCGNDPRGRDKGRARIYLGGGQGEAPGRMGLRLLLSTRPEGRRLGVLEPCLSFSPYLSFSLSGSPSPQLP